MDQVEKEQVDQVDQDQVDYIMNRWYREYIEATHVSETEFQQLLELIALATGNEDVDIDLVRSMVKTKVPNPQHRQRLEEFRSRQLKGEQGSQQWLRERHMYITASVSAACVGLMGPSARENQLLEKASFGAYSPFKGGYYTQKGNIFEDVTAAYYSYVNNKKIWAFGLIPHSSPKYGFLAASTDGVTDDLINIEIKTLVGRQPDCTTIKKEYYHQMQQQMECLGLECTDFIEVKYKETASASSSGVGASAPGRTGIIIEWWCMDSSGLKYSYAPIDGVTSAISWEEETMLMLAEAPDQLYIRSIYWKMTDYLCRRVPRDPKWIVTMGPKLSKFWDEVNSLRENSEELEVRISGKDSKREPNFSKCLI